MFLCAGVWDVFHVCHPWCETSARGVRVHVCTCGVCTCGGARVWGVRTCVVRVQARGPSCGMRTAELSRGTAEAGGVLALLGPVLGLRQEASSEASEFKGANSTPPAKASSENLFLCHTFALSGCHTAWCTVGTRGLLDLNIMPPVHRQPLSPCVQNPPAPQGEAHGCVLKRWLTGPVHRSPNASGTRVQMRKSELNFSRPLAVSYTHASTRAPPPKHTHVHHKNTLLDYFLLACEGLALHRAQRLCMCPHG